MSEPTLAITLSDLRQQVAYKLGYGRDYPSGSSEQDHVDDVMKRGLLQFYKHPMHPVIPDVHTRHKWSFLEPRTTIIAWSTTTGTTSGAPSYSDPSSTVTATAAGFHPSMIRQTFTFDTSGTDYTIDGYTSTTVITVTGDASSETSGDTYTVTADGDYGLPDDFGGIASPLTYDSATGYGPLSWVTPEAIQQRRNDWSGTGHPEIAALTPASTDMSAGQRWNLMLHPTPDQDYTLHYRYRVLPDTLTATTNEYPYGTSEHGETIMASCEAIAELEKYGRHGGMWEHFVTSLQASILQDRTNSAAFELGKNTCAESTYYGNAVDWIRKNSSQTIVVNGVTYT